MRHLITLSIFLFVLINISQDVNADTSKGLGIYMNFCASCHSGGLAGAPIPGDKPNWETRLAKGEESLINNAIKGFQGDTGFMPAKGGMSALSDEEVTDAVKYMLEQSK